MSRPRKSPPAHARSEVSSGTDGPGGGEGAMGEGGTLSTALRELGPPRHGPDFWTDLDRRLADEPQLRLAPRSAIRPITQPPPVIDDRSLRDGLKASAVSTPPKPSSRGKIIGAVAAVLVALLVVAALQSPEDDPATEDDAVTAAGDEPAAGERDGESGSDGEAGDGQTGAQDETSTTEKPTTTVPPGTIDPAAPLRPGGVGPLRIGSTMAELQAAGLSIQPDQAEFDASGGTCYIARVVGALDLELRFRDPVDVYGVDDPTQGILTAVKIDQGLPTNRKSGAAIGLGDHPLKILDAYGANLDERGHPYMANGVILRADNGDGNGIAYATDGERVVSVTVGEYDSVAYLHECP